MSLSSQCEHLQFRTQHTSAKQGISSSGSSTSSSIESGHMQTARLKHENKAGKGQGHVISMERGAERWALSLFSHITSE